MEESEAAALREIRQMRRSVARRHHKGVNIIAGGTDMLFICYPKCTTCKKAQAYLDDRGTGYDFRDIKLENPSEEELRQWWKTSGLPLKKFFNTSGLQYKALGLKDKLPTMSEDEQISLLATDGLLVKRPILVGDDFVLTGFRQQEWDEKLK